MLPTLITITGYSKNKDILPQWERYYKTQGEIYPFQESQLSNDSAAALIKEKITTFLKNYEWVIVASLDEYIIPNPFYYSSIKDYISKNKGNCFTTTGYEMKDGVLVRAELYDKVCVTSIVPEYSVSTHAKYTKNAPPNDPNLYLFHMKYL